jgi:hypothetical protein
MLKFSWMYQRIYVGQFFPDWAADIGTFRSLLGIYDTHTYWGRV